MRASMLFVGTALALATPVSAQELVTNGGFETGNFSGWTQTGNTGFTGVQTASASGAYEAYFGPGGTPGGITQSLATTPGQTYTVSFSLLNTNGAPTNFYAALFGGNTLFSATNSVAFGWTNFSTTATATGALTSLAFNFRHDPSFFYLDNVSVTAVNAAVPEPGTWAMMLLGFGAIGFAMRRRRTLSAVPQLS